MYAHASMWYRVIPTKIFFPTKVLLHKNFWIYGIGQTVMEE